MTSVLARKAGLALFEKHLQQYEPTDPVYETYVDEKGKERRRRRELPPGLSKRDKKILMSVQARARRLDRGFSICGLRFGWTFIIGIVPVVGDAASATLNYFLIVRKARKAELPSWLVRKMIIGSALSACVGLVPFFGDVIVATYKVNSRNAALLEEFLRIRGLEAIRLERGEGALEDKAVIKPGAGR